jgi:tetratricopeptide (TPR) repeat protein
MANVLVTRGDLDGAMKLYQQSLELEERLGDLQGKSATLHAMANVLVTRGDLDGAMKLYQQSLELEERLGDLKGKSATLHAMANVLVTRGDLDGAMRLYQQSLEIKERLGDLKGKAPGRPGQGKPAATEERLHLKGKAANVLVTRGDLDGAMRLYQQSLELEERLGDLKGKMAATLHSATSSGQPACWSPAATWTGRCASTSSRSKSRNAWAT